MKKFKLNDRLIPFLLFLMLGITAFIFGLHLISDEDFLWHLKTGEIILRDGPPEVDIYSFRTEGKEWIDTQWLFQLVIYIVYHFFGFSGESWFLAFLLVIIWSSLFFLVFEKKSFLLTFLMTLLSFWTASARFNLRPELFSWLLIIIYLIILDRDQKKRTRLVFLLPVLQIIWANLEGLWPIGLVIISSFFIEEFLFKYLFRKKVFSNFFESDFQPDPKRIFFIFLISIFTSLLTPYGFSGFLFPLTLLKQVSASSNYLKQNIVEFYPLFSRLFVPFIGIPYLALILISGLSFFLNRTHLKPSQWILWLIFLYLSLSARRNIPLFCIYSVFVFSTNISFWLDQRFFSERAEVFIRNFGISLSIALLLFLNISFINGKFGRWNKAFHQFGTGLRLDTLPVKPCAFLKDIGFRGRIFNQITTAGYLIWTGYPEFKVYVDGRLEVYRPEGIEWYINLFRNYLLFQAEDLQYGFDAVLLNSRERNARPLIVNLNADPRWALVYNDTRYFVFLKDKPSQKDLITRYRIKNQ